MSYSHYISHLTILSIIAFIPGMDNLIRIINHTPRSSYHEIRMHPPFLLSILDGSVSTNLAQYSFSTFQTS